LRIVYSDEAIADLLALEQYIAERDGAVRANKIVQRLEGVIRLLSESPGLGRRRSFPSGELRMFAVWPWLIAYTQLSDGDGIYVIRIVDGRRDIESIFDI